MASCWISRSYTINKFRFASFGAEALVRHSVGYRKPDHSIIDLQDVHKAFQRNNLLQGFPTIGRLLGGVDRPWRIQMRIHGRYFNRLEGIQLECWVTRGCGTKTVASPRDFESNSLATHQTSCNRDSPVSLLKSLRNPWRVLCLVSFHRRCRMHWDVLHEICSWPDKAFQNWLSGTVKQHVFYQIEFPLTSLANSTSKTRQKQHVII